MPFPKTYISASEKIGVGLKQKKKNKKQKKKNKKKQAANF